MHELLYPILQGFDSVKINADIELGGTDQLFNCTMGRQLQESHSLDPQIVMCMPLLTGLDGKEKMSKSLNNTIGLTDEANEMFGKIMSIPDELLEEYLELTTDFSGQEKGALKEKLKGGENPMNIKKIIAKNIIKQYHSEESALKAEQFFATQFQNKNFTEKIFVPIQIETLNIGSQNMKLIDLCHYLMGEETKSAIRRLIVGGGVQIDNRKVDDPNQVIELKARRKIRIGKRTFVELV